MKFIGEYNKSVLLTYLGVTLALTGVYFAFWGDIKYAFLMLIFAGICDLFDGAVARRCKRTKNGELFGVQIDSLADAVSFIALPCAIAFAALGTLGFVCVFYALAAIIRLAFFNVQTNSEGKKTHFRGLAVTYSALILPVYYLLSTFVSKAVFNIGLAALYIVIALLFILDVKIKKPGKTAYIFFALLAVFVSIGIILL